MKVYAKTAKECLLGHELKWVCIALEFYHLSEVDFLRINL